MKKLAKEIITGLEDAIAYAKGDKSRGTETTITISKVNVKSIRQKTGLTQEAFSKLFAVKLRTLQDWEQQRRTPSISARIFLALINKHPVTVKKTLKTLGYSSKKAKAQKIIQRPNAIRNPLKKFTKSKTKNVIYDVHSKR